jgi:hypothetical protein
MNNNRSESQRAREAWRRTLVTMRSEEMDDLLTPDEEVRWLQLVSRDVIKTPLSLRARTRQDVLDHLAVVLAESRGDPASR